MPITSRELIESRETRDEGPRRSTMRVYQVETTPDRALDPGIGVTPPLPEYDDKLGWDTTQVVFSRIATYERGSVTVSRVVISYSNDPPTFGGGNPSDPFFKSWTLSYYRVAQPMPYAIRDKRALRWVAPDGSTNFLETYPVASVSHWESRVRFMRRCRVTNFAASGWNYIGDQANKLVQIFDRWYLFTLSDIVETAKNVWDATYSFEYDPGTPSGVFPPFDNEIFFPNNQVPVRPPNGFPGAETWARPPYHEIRVIPGALSNGTPDWPTFISVCPYEVAETAHLSLPGFGPL